VDRVRRFKAAEIVLVNSRTNGTMGLKGGDGKPGGLVNIDRLKRVVIRLDGPPALVMSWPSIGKTENPAAQKCRQAAAEAVPADGSRSPPPYVAVEGLTDPAAFALVLDGDCMQPEYRHGEILVFSRLAPVRSGDDCLVVFFHPDDDSLCERFKRVFLEPGGSLRLETLNPKRTVYILEANRVLAVIRAVARADVPAGARPAAAGRLAPPARTRGQAGEPRSGSARSEQSPCLAMKA
jgi:hypothetical protein